MAHFLKVQSGKVTVWYDIRLGSCNVKNLEARVKTWRKKSWQSVLTMNTQVNTSQKFDLTTDGTTNSLALIFTDNIGY